MNGLNWGREETSEMQWRAEPQSAQHCVGGMYVFKFPSPDAFILAVGSGTQPEVLDRHDPNHAGLIRTLESMPLVFQAA